MPRMELPLFELGLLTREYNTRAISTNKLGGTEIFLPCQRSGMDELSDWTCDVTMLGQRPPRGDPAPHISTSSAFLSPPSSCSVKPPSELLNQSKKDACQLAPPFHPAFQATFLLRTTTSATAPKSRSRTLWRGCRASNTRSANNQHELPRKQADQTSSCSEQPVSLVRVEEERRQSSAEETVSICEHEKAMHRLEDGSLST